MQIALIDGSPKTGKSCSSFLLKALEPHIAAGNATTRFRVSTQPLTDEEYRELCRMDTLVLAFPLYVDAVPSHLFRMLVTLENYLKTEVNRKKEIFVYTIVNNGFFEGEQNHIAIDIVKNWCVRCGLHFGQGMGQGAGEMVGSLKKVPLGRGPLKNTGRALQEIAENILSRRSAPPLFVRPNFPRFVWCFMGTHFGWNMRARKNGLTKKDLLKHPSETNRH